MVHDPSVTSRAGWYTSPHRSSALPGLDRLERLERVVRGPPPFPFPVPFTVSRVGLGWPKRGGVRAGFVSLGFAPGIRGGGLKWGLSVRVRVLG